MSSPANPADGILNVARYVIAAMVLYGSLSTLLAWQRVGWQTTVSPIAQITEGVACVLVLWRPRAGLVAALVPMGLTLWFGTLEADLLINLLVPAAFLAVERARAAAAVVGLFLGYAAVRSVQVEEWEVAATYLVLLIPSVIAGLLLRALLAARRRGQGRVRVMAEDARRIRSEERSRLAAELRSLVAVRLADANAVLASARRLTDVSAMKVAIARVNEACLGALAEVRALVGMLREDPTAEGHDESVAGPAITTALNRLREQLEDRGARVSVAAHEDVDGLTRVTQSTVTRVMEEILDSVMAQGAAGADVEVNVERRRGRVSMDARFPAGAALGVGSGQRLDRLRERADALGGSLRTVTRDGTHELYLELPPSPEPPAGAHGWARPTGWHRLLSAGSARGLLTMGLTMGGVAAGGRLAQDLSAGLPLGDAAWEVAGFIAAGVLLWWPRVGALPAAAAAVAMLFTPHSDDLALAAILIVGSWHAARVTSRWAAASIGALASMALIAATLVNIGPARERAVTAAVVLLALPSLIAARHFLDARRRQMDEMAGLRRTTEGIRTEERNLLARELHDVVAHHLSVATLQSMAYGDSDDPVELRTALTRMERSLGGAEEEMELLSRIMAGAGGEETGIALVRPTTVVGVLAETLRDNGFRISVSVDPVSDGLPAPTLRTLTRVLQEGVTNILRYGQRDGLCDLTLDVGTHEVSLRMTNIIPLRRRTSVLSLGYGLAGIRERVDLLGGRFHAGAEGDAWVLQVTLPHAT